MAKEFKKDLIKGSFWSISNQATILLILLITNIWLARLLSPKEFGQIGIVTFFTLIMNVMAESGFGGALVRNKDASVTDYSTAFVSNLVYGIVIYIILFFSSSAIAHYYRDPQLHRLLSVGSLVVVINSFQISKVAKIISDMRFKHEFFYRFSATFLSSTCGIILAYQGFGVWSVIYMQLLNAIILTVILWGFEKFPVRIMFSRASFQKLFSFGIYTTFSNIINTFFDNIYQLVLGKHFSIAQTGNYYQAKKFQDIPGGVLNTLSHNVLFSSLSKFHEDRETFINIYGKIVRLFVIMLGFVSIGFYLYSSPIILLVLGPKWYGSVYFMQLLSIASFFYMSENLNAIIFKIYNRTKFIFLLDVFKKILQTITIVIGIYYKNIELLIFGFIIVSAIGYIANFYFSRIVLQSSNLTEFLIVLKVILACVITVCITKFLLFKYLGNGTFSLITIPLVIVLYITMLHTLNVVKLSKATLKNALFNFSR